MSCSSGFRVVTGLRVRVADPAIGTLQSPGVAGLFTAEQALKQLLTGTSVGFRFTDADAVTLELAGTSQFVEVTGRPRSVASPKFTEPLRDIPQTINVITSAVMEQQGATTLREVLRNVPGITFQAGEGGVPAGDQLSIRGFSARTDIFVDGVRDFGGYTRDSFNLEQVEVAKGPASGITGRGSTGGSINQVSKTPGLTASYGGSLGGGNAEYARSTLDINQPIAALPGTAVRLNAMWNDAGVPGRDNVESQRWGIAPSIAIGLGTPTRASLSYFHLAQDNLPEYGIPWVPVNTNPELAAYSNDRPPVDQSNFYGLKARDYENTATDMGTLQVDHDFSGTTTLRNITRYGVTDRDSVITAPRFVSVNTSTMLNRQLQSRDMEDGILANQTNLTARFQTGQARTRSGHRPRVRARDVRELRAHRPARAAGGSVRAGRRCALCRADRPQRRLNRRHGELTGGLPLRHGELRPAVGGHRRAAVGPLRRGLHVGGGDWCRHRVRAHRRDGQLARRPGVQAQGQRQHLRRLLHRVQPVG